MTPGLRATSRRPLACTVLVCLTVALSAAGAGPAAAQEVIIGTDVAPLFPGLRGLLGTAPPGLPPGATTVRIRDVRNIRGNNPFQQRQPLLNWNGQVVGSVAELLALVQGRRIAAGGFTCSPSTATDGSAVIFHIGPATGVCSVSTSGASPPGQTEGFFVANAFTAETGPGRVLAATLVSVDFTLVDVPGGFVPIAAVCCSTRFHAAPGTYQVTLRQTSTGRRWRISFTVSGIGPPAGGANFTSVSLVITSVTPL